jgi:arabinogalactan endo-1,4-beta-galactosidase
MVPVGTAQVGWMVTLDEGMAGTAGTAATVMVVLAIEIQVGDAASRAVNVWPPDRTPVKVTPAWKVPPSMEYS